MELIIRVWVRKADDISGPVAIRVQAILALREASVFLARIPSFLSQGEEHVRQ